MFYTKITTVVKDEYLLLIIFTFCITLSLVVFLGTVSNLEYVTNYYKFKRIKNNLNNLRSNVIKKTKIESNKGNIILTSLNNQTVYDLACYHNDNYYFLAKINKESYLPELLYDNDSLILIDGIDDASAQYCKYILNNNNGLKTVSCGIEMFDMFGYQGYFLSDNPCNDVLDIVQKNNN